MIAQLRSHGKIVLPSLLVPLILLLLLPLAPLGTTPTAAQSSNPTPVLLKSGINNQSIEFQGKLFFDSYGLWASDGTPAGTVLINAVKPASSAYFTIVNNRLFFRADDGTHGVELWASDGTPNGTILLKDINPGVGSAWYQGPSSFYPIPGTDPNFTVFNNRLFFLANDGTHGYELWTSDGTPDGTVLLKDIYPGVNDSYPLFNSTVVNNQLLFLANDGTHGTELWTSDGTPDGTILFKDINPGSNGSSPYYFTIINNQLFFLADDGTHGTELWTSDGTPDGTILFKDINPGVNGSSPGKFTIVNNRLFFRADDGTHGPEIWTSDGTPDGTILLKDIYPGVNSAWRTSEGQDLDFTVVDNRLFFLADDGTHGREIWTSDGTPNGTILLKDIKPGVGTTWGVYIHPNFTVVNNRLLFLADDGTHGREIWTSDGTPDGTILFKDINPGSNGSSPYYFTIINNQLFFLADDGTHGREIWTSDGTPDGTILFKDINPGVSSSSPDAFNIINNRLLFVANDGTHGVELWTSDGTPEGTILVKDINPLSAGSSPSDFFRAGRNLFFNASYGTSTGFWQSDGTASGTVQVLDKAASKVAMINGVLFLSSSSSLYGLSGVSSPSYSLSGRITDSTSAAVAGVTVSDGTRSATTDANGNYTLSGVPAGSYTLTPTRSGYSFTPATRNVTVSGNTSGQDFTATAQPAATYSVSGRITDSTSAAVAGVSVSDGTRSATTDANGKYTLSGVPAGSYTLTPTRSGYSFTPATRNVTVSGNTSGQDFTGAPVEASNTWTFLLYLDGEDPQLYPHFQQALQNLEALPSKPNLKIVALLDGPQNGDSRRLLVQPNGRYTPNVNLWEIGERNMGDPQTLQEFIDWGQRTYPADHYYLAVADHGNGNLGIAWDITNNNDYLTPAELGSAIMAGTNNGQRKIDVLHYDACLMGLLENAYQVKDAVDYLIFSQNLGWSVFGYGAYADGLSLQSVAPPIVTIASKLTALTTPRQFAKDIATTYFNSLGKVGYPRTITALDMSQLGALHQAVDGLSAQLSTNLNSIQVTVQNTRNATQMFDSRVDYSAGPEDDYADLYDFAQRLKQNVSLSSVQTAAQAVMSAVEASVVAEYHLSGSLRTKLGSYYGLDNAHGISIYFPPRSGSGSYTRYVGHQSFGFTTVNRWDDFLKDYFGLSGLAPETGELLQPVAPLEVPQNQHQAYLPLINR